MSTPSEIEKHLRTLGTIKEEIELLRSYFEDTREVVLNVNDIRPLNQPEIIPALTFFIGVGEALNKKNIEIQIIAYCIANSDKSKYVGENWHKGLKDLLDNGLAHSILEGLTKND